LSESTTSEQTPPEVVPPEGVGATEQAPGEKPVETAPAASDGEGGDGKSESLGEAKAPSPPEPDWRDKRIATLTRRLKELQERPPQPPTPPVPGSQQDIDLKIEARAREMAVIQEFNRRCDEAATAGRGKYGEAEFNGRVANIQKLVDSSDPGSVQAYNNLLQAAIDTGEGARVLHDLGADLNEAQRVLALNPTRMAVELTKKALTVPTEVSSAPKPITTVGSRGVTHERISPDDPDRADHLSTREWMARREKQIADRRRT